ncbi:esterase/lipase family protein [Actinokineospora sp. HUAS TT18]|uniref:esterase/lipase family protein n=1 Tax=Actinokineospora sp. HUAS TT18 TaxID=3447451 RepID=UPI003F5229CD
MTDDTSAVPLGSVVAAAGCAAPDPRPVHGTAHDDRPALARRVAAVLRLPLWHEAQALTQRAAIEQHPLWQTPPVDAGGLPVLLVGGMGSTPALLRPLRDLLHRLHCHVVVPSVGFGVGCGEATTQAVEDALAELVTTTGRPAVVIGHSRGGQFARTAAVRRPGLLRGLITLGSPLTRLFAVHPLLAAPVAALSAAGALGVPGLLTPACLWGGCCAKLRADLAGPFPDTVRFLSMHSRTDTIVYWRSTLDPAARHHEVHTSHGGLIWDPTSLAVIVAELASTLDDPLSHTPRTRGKSAA